ncbi:MAG: DUF4179 domain-containing protein [Peptococcaceae bacterium]|nr:DUF4179 domain-containing protein [Peptococcaceae bacterium]
MNQQEKQPEKQSDLFLTALNDVDFGESLEEAEVHHILGLTMEKIMQEKKNNSLAATPIAAKQMEQEVKSMTPIRAKKKYFTGLVACAALFLALTVSAVAYFQLDEGFQKFLKLDKDQNQLVEKAGTAINVEAENQGYRLVAKESIGDRNHLYVLLDLFAPEGTVLDAKDYAFRKFHFDLTNKNNISGGSTVNQLPDDDPTDNKISFVFEIEASEELVDADIFLKLTGLIGYNEEEEILYLDMDGDWDLNFPLRYEDVSQCFQPNITVPFNGKEVQVTEIYLSPLSLSVTLKGEAIAEYDRTPPPLPSEIKTGEFDIVDYEDTMERFPIKIILQDGSVLKGIRSERVEIDEDVLTRSIQFDRVIEMSDIAAVEFLGENIYLNK